MQLLVESHSLAPGSLIQSRDLAFTSFQIWEVPQDHSGQHNLPATHTCVFFNPNINISVGVTKDMLTLSQFQVQGQTTHLLWLKKTEQSPAEHFYYVNSFSEETGTTSARSS